MISKSGGGSRDVENLSVSPRPPLSASLIKACTNLRRRYFLNMAFLTRREQTLVAFVLLAFLVGLGTKHWRESRALAPIAFLEESSH